MRLSLLAFVFAIGAPVYASACPADVITRFGMSPSPSMTKTIQRACGLKPNTCEFVNAGACHEIVDKELRAERIKK